MKLWHLPEQHWSLLTQAAATALHPHLVLVQWPVQHEAALRQKEPSSRHTAVHLLLWHLAEQHSSSAVQVLSSASQPVWAQTPPMQLPEQQVSPTVHCLPSAVQLKPPQNPPLH